MFDELGEGRDEEEKVEKKFELVIENFGYEGKEVVFGIFDEIILVVDGLYSSIKIYGSLSELYIFEAIFFEPFEKGGVLLSWFML